MGSCTNQINQIRFDEMLVFEERGKPEYPPQSIEENQQTQPTFDSESGNRTRATLVGMRRMLSTLRHHCSPPPPVRINKILPVIVSAKNS